MSAPQPILVARKARTDLFLLPQMANRHGLIAGATGSGKTGTLHGLAESFSAQGVPVFLADVTGDLAGLSQPGGQSPKVKERAVRFHCAAAQPGRPHHSGATAGHDGQLGGGRGL